MAEGKERLIVDEDRRMDARTPGPPFPYAPAPLEPVVPFQTGRETLAVSSPHPWRVLWQLGTHILPNMALLPCRALDLPVRARPWTGGGTSIAHATQLPVCPSLPMSVYLEVWRFCFYSDPPHPT